MTATTLTDLFGPVIDTYSRADAIADGVLVKANPDLTNLPLCYTAAAFADCIAWDDAVESRKPGGTCQDQVGREWDVLTILRAGMKTHRDASRFEFTVLRVPATGRGIRPHAARLVAALSADDNGGPCITVMLPSED